MKVLKRILVGIGILIVLVLLVLYLYYYVWMKMGKSEISKAEAAFAKGIEVTDAQHDFVMMGTNKEEVQSTDTNNASPYDVPYLDIKSAQLGADEQNIYYKVSFYGQFPTRPGNVNGDNFMAIGDKIHIVDEKGEDQIVLHSDFGWQPVISLPSLNTSYDWCPTGIEWPESARMSCHADDAKIAGGNGTDYIMGAIPLKRIGLKTGQTIYIVIDEETKSVKYTHAAVDVLAGNGKSGGIIKWAIGSNKFEINNNPRQENSTEKK